MCTGAGDYFRTSKPHSEKLWSVICIVSTISVPISSHDEKQPDTDLATKFFVFEGADCDVTYTVKVTLGIYLIYI